MGPNDILVGANINFKDTLTIKQVEPIIEEIKKRIIEQNSDVQHIYLETDSIHK
jgi:divalent metal cation (Fe/Co/Zn/Cd) transporter